MFYDDEKALDRASKLIDNYILENRYDGDGRWCMNAKNSNSYNYLIPKTFDITDLYNGFENSITNHIYFYNLF